MNRRSFLARTLCAAALSAAARIFPASGKAEVERVEAEPVECGLLNLDHSGCAHFTEEGLRAIIEAEKRYLREALGADSLMRPILFG